MQVHRIPPKSQNSRTKFPRSRRILLTTKAQAESWKENWRKSSRRRQVGGQRTCQYLRGVTRATLMWSLEEWAAPGEKRQKVRYIHHAYEHTRTQAQPTYLIRTPDHTPRPPHTHPCTHAHTCPSRLNVTYTYIYIYTHSLLNACTTYEHTNTPLSTCPCNLQEHYICTFHTHATRTTHTHHMHFFGAHDTIT